MMVRGKAASIKVRTLHDNSFLISYEKKFDFAAIEIFNSNIFMKRKI